MADFDILVRRKDLRAAILVLNQLGWTPESEWSNHHAMGFKKTDGGHIDLHWHISHECLTPHATDDF